jgi:hypothetical protein
MSLSFHLQPRKEQGINGDRSAKLSIEPWSQFDEGDRQACLYRWCAVVERGGR